MKRSRFRSDTKTAVRSEKYLKNTRDFHLLNTEKNFDRYLEAQLEDPEFAERFQKAGEAWDVAIQLAALRNEAGMSQAELAKKVGTTQQQISRMESPSYEGHSLSMLRRVADVLGAKVYVKIQSSKPIRKAAVAESKARYGNKT